MDVCTSQKTEEGTGSLGTGLAGGCEWLGVVPRTKFRSPAIVADALDPRAFSPAPSVIFRAIRF